MTNKKGTMKQIILIMAHKNREQIEISRHYEKLPKPTLVAIKEFQSGEIYSRKIEA